VSAFNVWIDELLAKKIIIEVLSRGNSKCLVITRLKDGYRARRVDFLYTTPEEYPFAVLYFTGNKGFNATMRGFALTKDLSLNEHGLSKMVNKKKEEKLSLNIANERGIFDYLGLVYKEPNERTDGRAVVAKDGKTLKTLVIENDEEPDIAQKNSETKSSKSLIKEEYSSPKSQNKTRKTESLLLRNQESGLESTLPPIPPSKTKSRKDYKLHIPPKDPKKLEAFCVDLLKKKGEEKSVDEKEQNNEMPKYSAKPKSILKKETMGELPKGPTLKKTRKSKTVKISNESTIIPPIELEQEPLPPIKILPGSPKLNNVIELDDDTWDTNIVPKCSETKIESVSKKCRKNKTAKLSKEPKTKTRKNKTDEIAEGKNPTSSPKLSEKHETKISDEPIEKIYFPKLESFKSYKQNKTKKFPKVLLGNIKSKTPEGEYSPKHSITQKSIKKSKPPKDLKLNKQEIQPIELMPKQTIESIETTKSHIQQFKNVGITVL